MPRTRSRPKTEAKIQTAVLDLLADEGCCALGVNAVAQRAGADKVLIYRYFGDLYGLLQTVAESREWLPDAAQIARSVSRNGSDGASGLREACELVSRHIETDGPGRQVLAWRRAERNPLTTHFSTIWNKFWNDLAELFSDGLDYEERKAWKDACGLGALMVEARLCGEALPSECFARVSNGLTLGNVDAPGDYTPSVEEEENLPTNLL